MSTEIVSPAELVGREPDERLLSEDSDQLPAAVGRPETVPPSRVRRRVVGAGATLTGVSLALGASMLVFAVIAAIANGIDVGEVIFAVVGALLIATHWGWVHIAEITANSIEGRAHADVLERRRQWLAEIEPYAHTEVSTGVEEDGSISIVTVRYTPVPRGERKFTFLRDVVHRELHAPDEPAASVTERAEQLRREAALATERERGRYAVAAEAYRDALIDRADEEQRRLAQRAASEALSRQINTNLREPPLVE